MAKRERTDDEKDLNDTEVKRLVQNTDLILINQVYSRLSLQEREAFVRQLFEKDVLFKPFYGIPRNLLKIIATMTPGTLMKLAQTMDPFFIALARDDNVWKQMFRRDFPKDYEFSRGVLPFYIPEPTHPFYTPGSIQSYDTSPWKRYYLHTLREYYEMAWSITAVFDNNDDDIPGFFEWEHATYRECYNWIHQYILPKRYNIFDWRSTLAWVFIGAFVWYVTPENKRNLTTKYTTKTFKKYAKDRPWMMLYLICMRPDQNAKVDNFNLENAPIYGPQLTEKYLKEINHLFPLVSVDKEALFSKEDRGKLDSFITTSIFSNKLNPAFKNMNIEERTKRGEILLRLWDFFSDCHHIPCIFSLNMAVLQIIGESYMARESTQIRNGIQNLIAQNPTVILNLDMEKISTPIFSQPRLQEQMLNIMNIWYPIQQSNIFTNDDIDETTLFEIFDWNVNAPKYFFQKYSSAPRWQGGNKIMFLETCIQCGVVPAIPQQCGGTCERTVYCGVECQSAHWVLEHRNKCGIKN